MTSSADYLLRLPFRRMGFRASFEGPPLLSRSPYGAVQTGCERPVEPNLGVDTWILGTSNVGRALPTTRAASVRTPPPRESNPRGCETQHG